MNKKEREIFLEALLETCAKDVWRNTPAWAAALHIKEEREKTKQRYVGDLTNHLLG